MKKVVCKRFSNEKFHEIVEAYKKELRSNPSLADLGNKGFSQYVEKNIPGFPTQSYATIDTVLRFYKKYGSDIKIVRRLDEDNEDVEIETKTDTDTNQYSNDKKKKFVLSAWNKKTGQMMDIDEYCKHYNLPRKDIRSYKLVSHTGTPFYNIAFHEKAVDMSEVDFAGLIEEIVPKYLGDTTKRIRIQFKEPNIADRLIYTDTHIGMTTNPSGYSLYGGVWNKEEQLRRCEKMIAETAKNRQSNILHVDDLGDFLDGWNQETARGGHKLPQNMSNTEAFDAGLKFKMHMADCLYNIYDKIVFRNICDDNHSADFSYVLNKAFLEVCMAKYGDKIEVINQRKFIDYYILGKHAFVTTHGKDAVDLKFGFKPQIDHKQIEKIDQFLKSNDIYSKASYIEFSKGDSHQCIFDMAGSDDFDYFNYPALSPSSKWVQTNFKKGRSGFVIQHVHLNEKRKDIVPFWFDWQV